MSDTMTDSNTHDACGAPAIRHEPCEAHETFCGNTRYVREDSEKFIRWLRANGVKSARFGSIAFDIYGHALDAKHRPLFIDKKQEAVYLALRHKFSFQLRTPWAGPSWAWPLTANRIQWLVVVDGLLYSCMAESVHEVMDQVKALKPGCTVTSIADARHVCPIRSDADSSTQNPLNPPFKHGESHDE